MPSIPPDDPLRPLEVLAPQWPEYELLDSGRRRKLERFGPVRVVREEPKAWWEPSLAAREWERADAMLEGDRPWRLAPNAPREWTMRWRTLTFQARFADTSKHLGIFPEQAPHWEFIQANGPKNPPRGADGPPKLLNLFGYTGAATLAAAAAGFTVTHVDASKPAVAWARKNQNLSGMDNSPIRWILDDAVKFVRREVRRGVRYDALALDPPSFGRGPAGEIWKVETQLPELLALCRQALAERPHFVILTMYNLEASPLMLANALGAMMRGASGRVARGELALPGPLPLPLSLWARWTAE